MNHDYQDEANSVTEQRNLDVNIPKSTHCKVFDATKNRSFVTDDGVLTLPDLSCCE